jgi:hypothetical protein
MIDSIELTRTRLFPSLSGEVNPIDSFSAVTATVDKILGPSGSNILNFRKSIQNIADAEFVVYFYQLASGNRDDQ